MCKALMILVTFTLCLLILHTGAVLGVKEGIRQEDNVFFQGCMKTEKNAIICSVYLQTLRRGHIWCESCVRGKVNDNRN